MSASVFGLSNIWKCTTMAQMDQRFFYDESVIPCSEIHTLIPNPTFWRLLDYIWTVVAAYVLSLVSSLRI